MANQYRELYRTDPNLYLSGSPVIIEAAVLQQNIGTGEQLVQVKLRSLSEKRIRTASVTVKAFDADGTETESISGFEYAGLFVGNGQTFASKTPIRLSGKDACRISVTVDRIVFSDGTFWTAGAGEWTQRQTDDITELFYKRALALMADKRDKESLAKAEKLFKELGNYKDSLEQAKKCAELASSRSANRNRLTAAVVGAVAAIFVALCVLAAKGAFSGSNKTSAIIRNDTAVATPAPTAAIVPIEATPSPAVIATPQPTATPAASQDNAAVNSTVLSANTAAYNSGAAVYITKSPTSEKTYAGGSATFIAHAANATGVSWQMVNWDASVIYDLSQVPHYLGCTVSGNGTDTVVLSNVTSCMNGWRIQACYSGNGGPVYTDLAYIYVSSGSSSNQRVLQPMNNNIPNYLKSWAYSYDPSTGCIYYDESVLYPTNSYSYGSAPFETQQITDYYEAIYGSAIPIYCY